MEPRASNPEQMGGTLAVAQSTCSTCCAVMSNLLVHPLPDKLIQEPFKWRKTRAEFDKSLRQGCPLCHRFNDRLKRAIYELDLCTDTNRELEDEICLTVGYLLNVNNTVRVSPYNYGSFDTIVFKTSIVHGRSACSVVTPHRPNSHYIEFQDDTPLTVRQTHDVNSEKTYRLVRDWIQACDHDHSGCVSLTESLLPTRVIDVTSDNPRLVMSQGRASYAVLSYCWGMAQALTTTTTTLDQHILGISMNGLPQTIQDAIEVTRRLKLRYLWVDSLCILQDSEDDKAVEIAKMEKIYQNAYVTISAAGPSDCTLGFLRNLAAPLPMPMAPIILPFQAEDGTVSTCSLYEQFGENMRASLHKRAWTMQEHLLSPRLLVFST